MTEVVLCKRYMYVPKLPLKPIKANRRGYHGGQRLSFVVLPLCRAEVSGHRRSKQSPSLRMHVHELFWWCSNSNLKLFFFFFSPTHDFDSFLLFAPRLDSEHVVLRGDGADFPQTRQPVAARVHEVGGFGHVGGDEAHVGERAEEDWQGAADPGVGGQELEAEVELQVTPPREVVLAVDGL